MRDSFSSYLFFVNILINQTEVITDDLKVFFLVDVKFGVFVVLTHWVFIKQRELLSSFPHPKSSNVVVLRLPDHCVNSKDMFSEELASVKVPIALVLSDVVYLTFPSQFVVIHQPNREGLLVEILLYELHLFLQILFIQNSFLEIIKMDLAGREGDLLLLVLLGLFFLLLSQFLLFLLLSLLFFLFLFLFGLEVEFEHWELLFGLNEGSEERFEDLSFVEVGHQVVK